MAHRCRIVTDRETGKQKGFAFIEYFEPQTAQSAVRNLDQADLTGRKLKVTFAQKDMDTVMRQSRGARLPSCQLAPTVVRFACWLRVLELGACMRRPGRWRHPAAAEGGQPAAPAAQGEGRFASLVDRPSAVDYCQQVIVTLSAWSGPCPAHPLWSLAKAGHRGRQP